jgi:hypothetical protein
MPCGVNLCRRFAKKVNQYSSPTLPASRPIPPVHKSRGHHGNPEAGARSWLRILAGPARAVRRRAAASTASSPSHGSRFARLDGRQALPSRSQFPVPVVPRQLKQIDHAIEFGTKHTRVMHHLTPCLWGRGSPVAGDSQPFDRSAQPMLPTTCSGQTRTYARVGRPCRTNQQYLRFNAVSGSPEPMHCFGVEVSYDRA